MSKLEQQKALPRRRPFKMAAYQGPFKMADTATPKPKRKAKKAKKR
jgi:hypothetical protein